VPVDIKNHNGQTALMYACLHRNLEMVKVLLEFGADLNIQWYKSGSTALALACGGHGMGPANPAIVEYLLAHGADPHIKNGRGRSLMHSAATSGDEKIMQIVAKEGVPVSGLDAEGNPPAYAEQEWSGENNSAPLLEKVAEWNGNAIAREATTLAQPTKILKPLKFGR
jgi:ankyrin repeat protein